MRTNLYQDFQEKSGNNLENSRVLEILKLYPINVSDSIRQKLLYFWIMKYWEDPVFMQKCSPGQVFRKFSRV